MWQHPNNALAMRPAAVNALSPMAASPHSIPVSPSAGPGLRPPAFHMVAHVHPGLAAAIEQMHPAERQAAHAALQEHVASAGAAASAIARLPPQQRAAAYQRMQPHLAATGIQGMPPHWNEGAVQTHLQNAAALRDAMLFGHPGDPRHPTDQS
jgi:hypothetical protein